MALLRIPIWVASAVFGAWVADLYIPGFHIDGSLGTRLAVGGVIAVLFTAACLVAVLALMVPISGLMMIGAVVRMERAISDDDLLFADGPPTVRTEPHPVAKALGGIVLYAVLTALCMPLACFLAVRACRVVGMPVDLGGGFAGYFTVGLVLGAVQGGVYAFLTPKFRGKGVRPWVAGRLAFVAVVAVLWAAVELTGGVQSPVEVLVLATMFLNVRFMAAEPWGVFAQAPADVVAMWVLVWSSALLVNPVEFHGPWPPVLAAVAITALTLPLRKLAPPASRLDEAQEARAR
jgi:hypothetical protein